MHKRHALDVNQLARNESGLSALLIPFILTILLLIGAGAFGFWAFTERQDYKNNSDQKSAKAVTAAEEVLTKKLQAEFAEAEKSPLKEYTSPAAYGSVRFKFPKTWSGYVIEATQVGTSVGVNAYFHPQFVPNVQTDTATAYGARLRIEQRSYLTVLKSYDGDVKSGKVRVTPYRPPLMPDILGSRVDGFIQDKKNGSLVMLPLRDKTIIIWTEAQTFMNDFNNFILQNLTFVP